MSTPAFFPRTAVVFAAGKGERMRPLTDHMPKPLVPVNGKPLIEYTLDQLASAGVRQVIVNTYYKAEMMNNYLQGYNQLPITISHEKELLETGGGLVNALPYLGNDPIFVINGDIIFLDKFNSTPTLKRLASYWKPEMDMLLLLQRTEKAFGYDGKGDFDIGPGQKIMKTTDLVQPYVFTGVQILHPRLLQGMELKPFSLNYFFFRAIQKDYSLKGVYGLVHDGEWLHIGTPDGLNKASAFLKTYQGDTASKQW